jgi:hypothetical protein
VEGGGKERGRLRRRHDRRGARAGGRGGRGAAGRRPLGLPLLVGRLLGRLLHRGRPLARALLPLARPHRTGLARALLARRPRPPPVAALYRHVGVGLAFTRAGAV